MAEPATVTTLKRPPFSDEAEQYLLGAFMLDRGAWFAADETIAESDFYRPQHQLIYAAMKDLFSRGQPIDLLTVVATLERQGYLAKVGGMGYVATLYDGTPGASNTDAYAKIVREYASRRALLSATRRIDGAVYDPEGRSDDDLVDYAERQIFQVAESRLRGEGPEKAAIVVERVVKRVEALSEIEGYVTGQPTGFSDLDQITAGLQDEDLIVVAARPSMGKTALAMNIAESLLYKGETVLVFSLEMSADMLMTRLISSIGNIDLMRLRTGNLTPTETTLLPWAKEQIETWPLYIDSTGGMTPHEVRMRTRRLARQDGGLSLVVVDYMQLMRTERRAETRAVEIGEISRGLKMLAKEVKCPVLALSQVNRELERRQNKRPGMSDLRESGAIEQDADVIMFIYRDEVYDEHTAEKGIAEIIVGKQRNGPTGTVKLRFERSRARFVDTKLMPEG